MQTKNQESLLKAIDQHTCKDNMQNAIDGAIKAKAERYPTYLQPRLVCANDDDINTQCVC